MENPHALTLTLGPVAHGGHCVARHEGRVIFVRHGIPGEVVRVALTEHDDDASFWRADVTEVLEASADRVPHFWAEADSLRTAAAGQQPVGGAEFGHISRPRQRRLKAEVLAEQLHRLAGIELDGGTGAGGHSNSPSGLLAAGVEDLDGGDGDRVGSARDLPAGLGWRTRAGFAVTAAGGPAEPGRLGMHAHRSEAVLPVRAMPLAGAEINGLRLWEIDLTGITRIEVSAPANGSAPLVLLATDPQLSEKARGLTLKRIARQLQANAAGNQGAEGSEAASAVRVSVAGWVPESGALTLISGRGRVSETAVGHEFRVSAGGFWQIHRRAPDILTRAVMDLLTGGLAGADGSSSPGGSGRSAGSGGSAGHAGTGSEAVGYLFPGATVADLYAGAGVFSALLADAVGPTGSVLSVEGSAGSSKDARTNLHAASQVEIRQGRVERVLHERSGTPASGFDAIVLDPPRAGAGKNVVRQLIASAPRAIAYVSCDPASFARDVGYFRAAGWNLSKLRAFDLYPHTHHLETVALLTPGAGPIG